MFFLSRLFSSHRKAAIPQRGIISQSYIIQHCLLVSHHTSCGPSSTGLIIIIIQSILWISSANWGELTYPSSSKWRIQKAWPPRGNATSLSIQSSHLRWSSSNSILSQFWTSATSQLISKVPLLMPTSWELQSLAFLSIYRQQSQPAILSFHRTNRLLPPLCNVGSSEPLLCGEAGAMEMKYMISESDSGKSLYHRTCTQCGGVIQDSTSHEACSQTR